MITLSIDPATHGVGCCLFEGRELTAAGYAKNPVEDGDIVQRCAGAAHAAVAWVLQHLCSTLDVDVLVVELPQVYQRGAGKTKGDPNKNVLPLAMVDSAVAALLKKDIKVYSYQPHAWKGGTSKPENTKTPYVITTRVKNRLSAEELARVDLTKSVARSYDVIDSIGVGLHHLGRFEKYRVLARE